MQRTIEVEVTKSFIGEEGHKQPRERMRVHEARARYLIEHGLARLIKPAGPAETKPAEPGEKKSSGAPTTGPLTVSPSSSAPGQNQPSSSSEADPASTPNKSPVADVPGVRRRRRRSAL